MDFFLLKEWSPYIVGILIGFLNIGALLVSKKPLGASTSFLKVSGMIYGIFNKKRLKQINTIKRKNPN